MSDDQFPRVGGKYLSELIHLHLTNEGLEVTADVGDQETTVTLELYGARQLRLLLQRYEREMKAVAAQSTEDAGGTG